RLKNIDGSFTRGLSDIMKLSPISYHWNQLSGLDTTTSYSGFSAQNVRSAIPEAVGTTNNNGYLTLQDRPILAATVNAIKDIGSIGGVFKDNLIAWLGNSANGITSIFATRGHFSNELCVGDTCVTPEQFKAMVAASQQSAGIGSTPAPAQVNPPQQDATTTTIDTTDTESTSTPQADSSTTE
ncbi:MAG: hypothetical protein JWO50_1, partial [Candidatus Kaiserbacteria bacterium]|nr:hypothetical protein [Candidatus Kaiserbacteria bacterium]